MQIVQTHPLPHFRQGRVAVIALSAAVLLGACSSGSHATSSSPTTAARGTGGTPTTTATAPVGTTATSACALFTQADAARITGIAVQPSGDTGGDCSWDRADSTEHLAVVSLHLESGADQPTSTTSTAPTPSAPTRRKMCPVWATRRTTRRGFHQLVVLKGTNLLHIATIDYHLAPNSKPIDIAIARSVLD